MYFYQFLSLFVKNLCFEGSLKYILKYFLIAAPAVKITDVSGAFTDVMNYRESSVLQ